MTTQLKESAVNDLQMDMRLLARDGSVLGTADKLIFELPAQRAAAVVVHTGRFGRRDLVVPLDRVTEIHGRTGKTDLSRDGVEHLPRFDERDYRRPPKTWMAPSGWTTGNVRWLNVDEHYPVAPPDASDRSSGHTSQQPLRSAASAQLASRPLPVEERHAEECKDIANADPYDVLQGHTVSTCKTTFEWGDASDINPMTKPEESAS